MADVGMTHQDIHKTRKSSISEEYEPSKKTYEEFVRMPKSLDMEKTVVDLVEKLNKIESEQGYNVLIEAVSRLTKEIHLTNGRNKSLKNDLDSITKQLLSERDKITDLDLRFHLNESSTQDGHLIWKINDFSNRTNDALVGKIRALHSAPCFTSKYGYKFCLRLYLHGDGMGRGTHLSLFLVIMKSEYDDILQWPFQKKIKFKLINQQDRGKDHVEQMFANKDSSSFQKPKKEMNIASGCPLFAPLSGLETDGFLRNGNLFIEVNVE